MELTDIGADSDKIDGLNDRINEVDGKKRLKSIKIDSRIPKGRFLTEK